MRAVQGVCGRALNTDTRDRTPVRLRDPVCAVSRLTLHFSAAVRACEHEMKALTEEVGTALLLLAEHRKYVRDQLRDVKGSLAAVKDTVLRA